MMYVIYTTWLKREWVPCLGLGTYTLEDEALTVAQNTAAAERAAFPNDPSRIVVVECTNFPKTMDNATVAALMATGKAITVI